MKLTKYLLVACSALLFAACSSDDWNTDKNVTVEMAQATLKTKENVGTFYVPLKVDGTTNGPIKVTVDVEQVAASPAVEDVHYLVTSKSVVIPSDTTEVSIEILAINDMDLNEDREFVVTIVKAEGATIGAQNSTYVTIRDDEGLVYESIQGAWTWSCLGYFDDAEYTYTMKISGVDEDEPDYEKILYFSGWGGASNLVAKVEYELDEINNEVELYFPFGQSMGQLNFTGLGACDVMLYGVDGGYLVDDGGVLAYGKINENGQVTEIEFDPDVTFIYAVEKGGEYLGVWDGEYEISMTR